ncbi:MAG TPA: FxSxx-COOH system tetratricopeptide repeat protein [Ktedonobacteraceae bacterium]|nr:FxSxx-COOH system tetratricopeptide repeat protein [Ktedonobacteraceae bacterium]
MTRGTFASFGAVLRGFRTRRELTQQTLAEKLGVRRNTIGSWERGDFLPQSKGVVLELARHLHLDDEEIRQLLEASLTLAPYWLVPLRRNPYFTGREEILETMHMQLGFDQTVALTQSSALRGLGGVGKTQIALEYAYRHALEYSAVFWIGAETEESIVACLLHIAEMLHLPEREDTDMQRAVMAVQRWLSAHGRWLLIWDNVEDLALLDRFLPATRSGAILLTTRRQALGTLAHGLDLLPMEQEEGILLLLRRAKLLAPEATGEHMQQFAERMPAQYAVAAELVTVLGGLPLALDQAGAYVEETHCGLAAYLDLFRTRRDALLQRRGEGLHDHPASVSTTFTLAIMAAAERHPAVKDLLQVCAFLQPDAIPEELFRQGGKHLGAVLEAVCRDPLEWDRVIGLACSYSLLSRQSEEQTLFMHRLVQVVLRESLEALAAQQWSVRIFQAMNAAFPEPVFTNWAYCERYVPHAQVSLQLIEQAGRGIPEARELFLKTGRYLVERGRYTEAEQFVAQICAPGELQYKENDPETASRLDLLATIYWRQGKYQQAEPLFQRALTISEQCLGPNHFDTSTFLNNMALLYLEQGNYRQAEILEQRALTILEHLLDPMYLDLAVQCDNMGRILTLQGKYTQAEQLFQRALAIWEGQPEPPPPSMIYSLNNLGVCYLEQRKYELAEPLFQRALALRLQSLGPDHPLTASSLHNLARLFLGQGKLEEAAQMSQRALLILEQRGGSDRLALSRILENLGVISQEQSKYEQAESLLMQALTLQEQHLGQCHPEMGQTLHDLALLRQKQGNLKEATSFAERALHIRLQSLGDAHPKTIATQTLYTQLVREQEAEIEPTLEHLRTLLKARGWSLHLKKRRGKPYVYATRKAGQHTHSRYLAPLSNPVACLASASTLPNAKKA